MAGLGAARHGRAGRGKAEHTEYGRSNKIKEKKMHEKLREGVIGIGEKALEWLEEYFEGKDLPEDKMQKALRTIQLSVKVSHMEQIGEQTKRSQAIRIFSFIPEDRRAEYIAVTNPEAKPYLLSKPKEADKKHIGAGQ